MAEDDLLALRQLYEEFANGNFGKGSELFAPDVVFEPFPERSAIHGLESIIAASGLLDDPALVLERHLDGDANAFVVLDGEDPSTHSTMVPHDPP